MCGQKREIPVPMFWGANDDQQRGQCGQSRMSEEKTVGMMRKAERWQGWELEACSAYIVNNGFYSKGNSMPAQDVKKQRYGFVDKGPYSQSYEFSISHVWMWELDHKQGWVLKNWCFWVVVLEKTLESPLDSREIKPVNPKGKQPWLFVGRTDVWSSNNLASWCKELTHWKRPSCRERLRTGGEGDNGGQDGWISTSTQWTWVWANSR